MNWKDWGTWNGVSYSGSDQDFDLELYIYQYGNWSYLGGSYRYQNGSQWPVESICGYISGSGTYTLGVAIYKYNATKNVKHELFFYGGSSHEYKTYSGSITTPSDSPFSISVGALNWSDNTQLSYSSEGPTEDGRIKPDLAGPTGVSTASYTTFTGTSASTPHVAGAIALLLNKTAFTKDQILQIIYAKALDLGTAGKDNKFGEGGLNLKK